MATTNTDGGDATTNIKYTNTRFTSNGSGISVRYNNGIGAAATIGSTCVFVRVAVEVRETVPRTMLWLSHPLVVRISSATCPEEPPSSFSTGLRLAPEPIHTGAVPSRTENDCEDLGRWYLPRSSCVSGPVRHKYSQSLCCLQGCKRRPVGGDWLLNCNQLYWRVAPAPTSSITSPTTTCNLHLRGVTVGLPDDRADRTRREQRRSGRGAGEERRSRRQLVKELLLDQSHRSAETGGR